MNHRILITALVLAAFAAGFISSEKWRRAALEHADVVNTEPTEREILYWVAPMDASYRRDEPGKSPMGMDLVPVYADEAAAGDTVTINPAVVNNLGVRTEAARFRPLQRLVEATAYVGFDETRIIHVHTRVQGWVVNLQVNAEGERVSRGDLLFELYSPELVNAQKEYVLAQRRSDTQLLAAAEGKLRALGMIPADITSLRNSGQVSENIRFVAPRDGIVETLNVREGMHVQPNTTTVSLADLSSVWLQAEVFESQAGWVAAGQVAEARLDYLPGAVLTGQVDYVYPVLDPMMRTLKVRLRFDNPGERLKPNMYARVSIHGHEKPLALTIPREALIPTQDSNRVVLALGEGKFRVHEVVTGLESGEYVEVLAGVSEGDEIVTSAQFLIDSEASISGSIRRLETVAAPHEQHQSGRESAGEKDSQTDRERRRIMAGAVVRGVDRASNIVKLEHEPISALNWPAMTMNFEVDSSVALDTLREGQAIHFSMLEVDTNEWVIDQIHVMEADTDTDTGHEGHHHD